MSERMTLCNTSRPIKGCCQLHDKDYYDALEKNGKYQCCSSATGHDKACAIWSSEKVWFVKVSEWDIRRVYE